MLYTKYESSGPCSFREEDFWKLPFENLLWPHDLLMQPIRTIWTILVLCQYFFNVVYSSRAWYTSSSAKLSCITRKTRRDGRKVSITTLAIISVLWRSRVKGAKWDLLDSWPAFENMFETGNDRRRWQIKWPYRPAIAVSKLFLGIQRTAHSDITEWLVQITLNTQHGTRRKRRLIGP